MNREKYESLPLKELREVAKARGLKGISTLRKAQLVDRMLEEDRRDEEKRLALEGSRLSVKQEQGGTSGVRGGSAASGRAGKTAPREQAAAEKYPVPQSPPAPAAAVQFAADPGTEAWQTTARGTAASQVPTKQTLGEPAPAAAAQFAAEPDTEAWQTTARGTSAAKQDAARQSTAAPAAAVQSPAVPEAETAEESAAGEPAEEESTGSSYRPRRNRSADDSADRGRRQRRTDSGSDDADDSADRTRRQRRTDSGSDNADEAGDGEQSQKQQYSGKEDVANGILEVLSDGYGFIRSANFLPGEHDVYVSPSQIRKFSLKTGDFINGTTRMRAAGEKFSALIHINTVNDLPPEMTRRRKSFEDMIPIFPNERLRLEYPGVDTSMRIVDLVSPIGKGQRGMIVSQPKAGKTTLLKQIARSVLRNAPDMHMIILLIDERPEEVTDMKEAIKGDKVEVIYSTFDELPEHHKRVSEMVIERAKRLVEHRQDVIILLDSITRLARAYNLTVPPSGRTLSGGLDPAALHMPKRFFGAARNMRGGGSLTILATALVDTGSKMDDVVYEEFKGTGNMELVLDRKLSERRVFPAVDIAKSGTRREDLLLTPEEQAAVLTMRRSLNGMKAEEASETILNLFLRTRNNREFCEILRKRRV